MFKAMLLYSAAADYSTIVMGGFSDRDRKRHGFHSRRNRAVGRLRGLLIYFGFLLMLLQYSISQPAVIRQQRMVGITHYSFGEYCVACCEDEGGRILLTLASSLKLRRLTEALAEVGANEGSGFGELCRISCN
jgi:hypothetical protein